MFEGMQSKEGLTPDYDSYSAVITSYLKEAVRAYRQFATSHPGAPMLDSHRVSDTLRAVSSLVFRRSWLFLA